MGISSSPQHVHACIVVLPVFHFTDREICSEILHFALKAWRNNRNVSAIVLTLKYFSCVISWFFFTFIYINFFWFEMNSYILNWNMKWSLSWRLRRSGIAGKQKEGKWINESKTKVFKFNSLIAEMILKAIPFLKFHDVYILYHYISLK